MPSLNSIKRMNRHQQGKQEGSVSGVDSPRAGTEKFRPLSQPSSQQYESMASGGLVKHASIASALPDVSVPSKWGRSKKEVNF